jgi:hypothetical protein
MENVKKAVEVILKTVVKIDKALEDKKVSIPESLGIAMSAVPWIGVFKNIPAIAEELKNWDETKSVALVETFKTNLELRNKATEEMIEQAVEVLLRIVFMVFIKPKEE